VPKTEAKLLPGHDGIQEYDNPIPSWMSWILGLTIVWSVIYVFYYGLDYGQSNLAEYQASVAENVRLQFAEIGMLKPDEPTMLNYMGKPDWMAFGRSVYQSNCQSCHGPTGLGVVGTNLCDDSYKNVEKLVDIPKIVGGGAAGGQMPAWGSRLHPNEVVLVSAYVATLRGSASGGKAPEGKVIPPWPPIPVASEGPKK
jgi:cytochrome c oxidase cbb3-type subunit 3